MRLSQSVIVILILLVYLATFILIICHHIRQFYEPFPELVDFHLHLVLDLILHLLLRLECFQMLNQTVSFLSNQSVILLIGNHCLPEFVQLIL